MNDKTKLLDLLKEIEIISLDLISKGRLNNNSLHEIVIYSTSILWERDLMNDYFKSIPKINQESSSNVIPFSVIKNDET